MTSKPKFTKKELLKLLASLPDEQVYVCTKCGDEVESEKPRKRCSKCKGKLIVQPQPSEKSDEAIEKKQSTFLAPSKQPKTNRKRVNPDTGEEEGIYTRPEPINIKTKLFEAGTLCQNDRDEWDAKVKYNRTPRREGGAKRVHVKCEGCGNEFNVHPIHVGGKDSYFCDKCITKKARR